jgi:branched-chain amino acid transport system ATP-binding protein
VSEEFESGLRLSGLTVERNGFPVVRDLDLHAPLGSVTVLLGPNGAGKTTVLEAISGVIASALGEIEFAGQTVTGLSRVKRSRLGLGHVQQGRAVFSELTVAENIEVARRGTWSLDEAYAIFPELRTRHNVNAGMLSGGEQQMLVIARALAAQPKLLLLDELSLGLAPIIAQRLIAAIRVLADESRLGVVLVEQFAPLALSIGDRAYVLRDGRCIYDGVCDEVTDDVLRGAYLGASDGESDHGREPPRNPMPSEFGTSPRPTSCSTSPGRAVMTAPPAGGGAETSD